MKRMRNGVNSLTREFANSVSEHARCPVNESTNQRVNEIVHRPITIGREAGQLLLTSSPESFRRPAYNNVAHTELQESSHGQNSPQT